MKFNVNSVELQHKMVVPSSYSGYLSLTTSILSNFRPKQSRNACIVHVQGVSSAEVVNMDVFQKGNSAAFVRAGAHL